MLRFCFSEEGLPRLVQAHVPGLMRLQADRSMFSAFCRNVSTVLANTRANSIGWTPRERSHM